MIKLITFHKKVFSTFCTISLVLFRYIAISYNAGVKYVSQQPHYIDICFAAFCRIFGRIVIVVWISHKISNIFCLFQVCSVQDFILIEAEIKKKEEGEACSACTAEYLCGAMSSGNII